jgi:DNA-binding CsgD family transcriptional regulator
MRCFEIDDPQGCAVPHVVLSLRERQVLSLLVRGRVPKEIGVILGISPATVRNHLRRLSLGLGVHGQAAMIRWALCYPAYAEKGKAIPKLPHPDECPCGAPYCQAVRLVG